MDDVRRVVVGYDGSESARTALEWAAEEARRHAATLQVWTVLEENSHGLSHVAGDEAVYLGELRATARELTPHIAAEFRTGWGSAAAELCAACSDADLLVVGSRGRNPLAGLVLGSVSRACLQHAPCSVVVVPAAAKPTSSHRRVIVGIDTSGDARKALHVAAREARQRGAELQVIHALPADHLGAELVVPTTRQLTKWAGDVVRTELPNSGVKTRATVLNGNPPDVLVRHSATADLLVLGARGHNALTALTLGSTSDHCVRHATCPVLIVRPDDQEPPSAQSSSVRQSTRP